MKHPNFATDMLKALRKLIWNIRLSRLPSGPEGSRLLHIGCGEVNSPEFINLDARPLPHVHIVSRNLFNLRSIPDASLDMVYMSHVLEHVPRGQLLQTLKEMRRVLKTGGLLRVSVPDFDLIIRIYEATGGDIHAIAPALMGGRTTSSTITMRCSTAAISKRCFTKRASLRWRAGIPLSATTMISTTGHPDSCSTTASAFPSVSIYRPGGRHDGHGHRSAGCSSAGQGEHCHVWQRRARRPERRSSSTRSTVPF